MRLTCVGLAGALILTACGDDGADAPPDPPAPLVCDPPNEISCATDMGERLPLRVDGSTEGAEDAFGGASCGLGGDTIEDAAFLWTSPREDTYTFSTEGSGFDTFLSLRNGSCFGREFDCNDDAEPGVTHSRIEVDLPACERVMIIVDGPSVDAVGDFRVSVHGSEQTCDDGLDDDGDGLEDCDDPDCFSRICPGEDLWPQAWSAGEWEVLEIVNQRRAEGATCGGVPYPPAGPLEMDTKLRLSARLHCQDMVDQNYYSHDSLDGRMLGDRVSEAGFMGAGPLAENIARGTSSAASAMAGWMESEGHCTNIMNPAFHVIGIGFAEGAGGTRWTQNFGGSH